FVTTIGKVSIDWEKVPPDDPNVKTFVLRDFMGNETVLNQRWVDRTSWDHIYPLLKKTAERPEAPSRQEAQEWIIVSGTVGTNGTAAFSPFIRYTGLNSDPERPSREYTIELQNSGGQILS